MKTDDLPSPPHAAAGLIHVHSAAKRIGCSRRTVRRWIEQGKLHAFRPGRRSWMLSIRDVEEARMHWEAAW